MNIEIQRFPNWADTPESIRRVCRLMGYKYYGHLRSICTKEYNHHIQGLAVIKLDGRVVGWWCKYDRDPEICVKVNSISIWVQHRWRNRGLGDLLVRDAFEVYGKNRVRLYAKYQKVWRKLKKEKKDSMEYTSPNQIWKLVNSQGKTITQGWWGHVTTHASQEAEQGPFTIVYVGEEKS